MSKQSVLDDVEMVEDEVKLGEAETPTPNDYEWTEYVTSLLHDKEKENGNPTVPGLRRICGVVYGDVLQSESDTVQAPNPDNSGRAVVHHRLVIERHSDKKTIVVEGIADCFYKNTDAEYARHASATAETKAEGRAYKRALKLNVVTAEETTIVPVSDENESKITDNQINMLDQIGMRVGVNIQKLVEKNYPGTNKIRDLSHADGAKLFKTLSSYQGSDVPEDLQGYINDWRTVLD